MKLALFATPLLLVNTVGATDTDVVELNDKVQLQVDAIAATGLLPTFTEVEVIMGDIVATEVTTTALTVAQAVEKYQLTPMLERYIQIKQTQADLAAKSNGGECSSNV